ncbi:MAG: hypothetical protein ABIS23_05190 [Sphingomicrobium sp.]
MAPMQDSTRVLLIMTCGFAIIALGVLSALLPVTTGLPSSVIGLLLIGAGLIEIFAGTLRQVVHRFAAAAGAVTTVAGLLFLISPSTHFLPTVWPVIGWLLIRSAILFWNSQHTGGSVRLWTGLSAGMDLLLAVLLIAGLSITTLIVGIFGPTPPLIASFSWVLAASFAVTGTLLIEVANCERQSN